MTLPSDPDQDGFEFAGEPDEPSPAGAILAEFVPDDDDGGDDDDDDGGDDDPGTDHGGADDPTGTR
jgi:hypothetical protein